MTGSSYDVLDATYSSVEMVLVAAKSGSLLPNDDRTSSRILEWKDDDDDAAP